MSGLDTARDPKATTREMNPLNLFASTIDSEIYEAGDTVFTQGQPGDCFYVVREGEVEIVVNGRSIDTVGPGGIIGEMALIDQSERSATATAKSRCTLIPVDQKRFAFLVSETPLFSVYVMKVMATRLRRLNRLIGN